MNVIFNDNFKSELEKSGGNVIISGVYFFEVNAFSSLVTTAAGLTTSDELISVVGSKNVNNNTLETYFELPEDYIKTLNSKNYTSIVYYWNKGAEGTTDKDKLEWAFIIFNYTSSTLRKIDLSSHRNLVSIELPENAKSNIIFDLPDDDFRFLEKSDPFTHENLTREITDPTKTISPESFYKAIYLHSTFDGKIIDALGRDTRQVNYRKYKELRLTCDSTITDFGRTIRYGLSKDVASIGYNSQYFQGIALYDEYIYHCGELVEIKENLSTPINTVDGIRLVSDPISEGEGATKFTVDNSKFCVNYTSLIDIAQCTTDVHAELCYYNREIEKIETLCSNVIRITQQDKDTSLMIVPNTNDLEKYYRTTENDVRKYGIESGTTVIIVEPKETEDIIVIHSVEPINKGDISLDFNDAIKEAFDITIRKIDKENQNIEIGLKIKEIEGYVCRSSSSWYPIKELTETVEPWLYPVTVTYNEHSVSFCPVIKNSYLNEATIQYNNETGRLTIEFSKVGSARNKFGIANSDEELTLTNCTTGEIAENNKLKTNTEYSIKSSGKESNLVIYQSDVYIDDFTSNTDWRKEIMTHLYSTTINTDFDFKVIQVQQTSESGIIEIPQEGVNKIKGGIGVYQLTVSSNSVYSLSLTCSSNINAYFYNKDNNTSKKEFNPLSNTPISAVSLKEKEAVRAQFKQLGLGGKQTTVYIVVDKYIPSPSSSKFTILLSELCSVNSDDASNPSFVEVYLSGEESIEFIDQDDAFITVSNGEGSVFGNMYLSSTVVPTLTTGETLKSYTSILNIKNDGGILTVPRKNLIVKLEFNSYNSLKEGGFKGTLKDSTGEARATCYVAAQSYINLKYESEDVVTNREIRLPAKQGESVKLYIDEANSYVDGDISLTTSDANVMKAELLEDYIKITNVSSTAKETDTSMYLNIGPSKTLQTLGAADGIYGITAGRYSDIYRVSPNKYHFIKDLSENLTLYGNNSVATSFGESREYVIIKANGTEITENIKITSDVLTIKNTAYSSDRKQINFTVVVPSIINNSKYYNTKEGYAELLEESKQIKTYSFNIKTESGLIDSNIEITQSGISNVLVIGNGNDYPVAVQGKHSGNVAGNVPILLTNGAENEDTTTYYVDLVLGTLNLSADPNLIEFIDNTLITLTSESDYYQIESSTLSGEKGIGITEFNGADTKPNIRLKIVETSGSMSNTTQILVKLLSIDGDVLVDNIISLYKPSKLIGDYPNSVAFSSNGSRLIGGSYISGNKIKIESLENLSIGVDELYSSESDYELAGDNSVCLEEGDNEYRLGIRVKNNSGKLKDGKLILTFIGEDSGDRETIFINALQGYYSPVYSIGTEEQKLIVGQITINNPTISSDTEYSTLIYLMIRQQEYSYKNGKYELGEVSNVSWNTETLCSLSMADWSIITSEGEEITGESRLNYLSSPEGKTLEESLLEEGKNSDSHYYRSSYVVSESKLNEPFSIKINYEMTLKYPKDSQENVTDRSYVSQGSILLRHNMEMASDSEN